MVIKQQGEPHIIWRDTKYTQLENTNRGSELRPVKL